MTNIDYERDPGAITQQSFAMIESELAEMGYALTGAKAAIIERMIHSTADFDFAKITRFSEGAIEAGLHALQNGCAVITDVNMIRVGVSERRITGFGGSLHCFVNHETTNLYAKSFNTTRSAAGIEVSAIKGHFPNSVLVIGNAPTALYQALKLADIGIKPALIVGVPVGFISAVESKDALMERMDVPWIATEGRKGGSPVAVSIVNALLRLAAGSEKSEIEVVAE
ncbi:MAG: precorrin-8X methylmutase [Chloroflexota bacterium]